jgi:hypothetical protein
MKMIWAVEMEGLRAQVQFLSKKNSFLFFQVRPTDSRPEVDLGLLKAIFYFSFLVLNWNLL